jgi:hypothetical protein
MFKKKRGLCKELISRKPFIELKELGHCFRDKLRQPFLPLALKQVPMAEIEPAPGDKFIKGN